MVLEALVLSNWTIHHSPEQENRLFSPFGSKCIHCISQVTVLWKYCGWNHKNNNRSLVSAVLQSVGCHAAESLGKHYCIYMLMITNMEIHLLRTQLFTACTN